MNPENMQEMNPAQETNMSQAYEPQPKETIKQIKANIKTLSTFKIRARIKTTSDRQHDDAPIVDSSRKSAYIEPFSVEDMTELEKHGISVYKSFDKDTGEFEGYFSAIKLPKKLGLWGLDKKKINDIDTSCGVPNFCTEFVNMSIIVGPVKGHENDDRTTTRITNLQIADITDIKELVMECPF